MDLVEKEWSFMNPTLVGYVPGRTSSLLTAGAKKFPDVYRKIKEAALSVHLDVDGALVACGVKRFPVVHERGTVGVLVSWPYG